MGDPLYVWDTKRVWCLDPSSGAVLWQQTVGGFFKGRGDISSVFVDDGQLLISRQEGVCCLDARTGEQRWATELEGRSYKVVVTRSHPLANRGVGMG